MELQNLVKIPSVKRTMEWSDQFCQAFAVSKVRVLDPQPQQGPDGFSYLLISTDEDGTEAVSSIINWAVEKGVGLVVNPHKQQPDFIFTFGMLWNFLARNEFITTSSAVTQNEVLIEHNQEVLTGAPSDSYWPPSTRKLFREFLLNIGVFAGKVVLLLDKEDTSKVDLCFSLESLGKPPQQEWAGILEGFSWFFPRHYSLAIVSEKNLPGAPFTNV